MWRLGRSPAAPQGMLQGILWARATSCSQKVACSSAQQAPPPPLEAAVSVTPLLLLPHSDGGVLAERRLVSSSGGRSGGGGSGPVRRGAPGAERGVGRGGSGGGSMLLLLRARGASPSAERSRESSWVAPRATVAAGRAALAAVGAAGAGPLRHQWSSASVPCSVGDSRGRVWRGRSVVREQIPALPYARRASGGWAGDADSPPLQVGPSGEQPARAAQAPWLGWCRR